MTRLAFLAAAVALGVLLMSGWNLVSADEIKLKSGEVIKDCTVKRKKGGKWTVILVDGSRRTIKEADVASHVEKPTICDDLEGRLKKAGKKDLDALLQIGRDAAAAGAKKQMGMALRKVIKLDRNHEEAHALLGNEKCKDGKWRGGRALEKYREKERVKELKAKGWVKVKGEWVDPVTAKNLKDGLIKIGDKWYTKADAARVKAGQFNFYGTWYDKGDREKLKAGQIKFKGAWMDLREANSKVRDSGKPWRLVGDHFIVIGPQGYDKLLTFVQHLDDTWAELKSIFGTAPATSKEEDKIKVFIAKDNKAYLKAHDNHQVDDRGALFSSAMGGYFSNQSGAILSYYYNVGYVIQWTQAAGACAFQARVFGYKNCPSPFYDAIACYIQGFHGGKYVAYSEMHFNGFRQWAEGEETGDPFDMISNYNLANKLGAAAAERRFARLGFVIHWLRQKHPEILTEWVSMVSQKKGTSVNLVERAKEMLKGTDYEKEFGRFAKNFAKSYQEPIPKPRF